MIIPLQRKPTLGDAQKIVDETTELCGGHIDLEFRTGVDDLQWRWRCRREYRFGSWQSLLDAALEAQQHMVLDHELEELGH